MKMLAEVVGVNTTFSQRAVFHFANSNQPVRALAMSCLVQDLSTFPPGAEAITFEMLAHTAIRLADGRVSRDEQLVAVSGIHLIKMEPLTDPNYETVPVHPDLEGKFWVTRHKVNPPTALKPAA